MRNNTSSNNINISNYNDDNNNNDDCDNNMVHTTATQNHNLSRTLALNIRSITGIKYFKIRFINPRQAPLLLIRYKIQITTIRNPMAG
jgi:hypothetical protein